MTNCVNCAASSRGSASNTDYNQVELLATRKFCDTCGSTLDGEMLSGFCPGCLLNTVLEAETKAAQEVALRLRVAQ